LTKVTKKSGGPQTEEGKAVASRNSLKTGAYSSIVVLPGEDEADFHELETQFISDFSPQDIAEVAMVRQLAVSVWKKLRLERLEQSAALMALNRSFSEYDFNPYDIQLDSAMIELIPELDSFTEDYVQAMRDMFFYVARFEVDSLSLDDVKVMALEYPALYLYVIEQAQAEDLLFDKNPTPADVLNQSVVYSDGDSVNLIPFVINGTIDYARNVVRVYSRRDEIKAAVKSVKEKRLLVIMELDKPRRVHSDLDRAFYRTLSELRKHQQWRQARNIIDVTPKLPA
jgi:hypothetical protein